MFGRRNDCEAEFVERGAVLLGGHLLVGLFVVARLGKLSAEQVAFGHQCGDLVAQDILFIVMSLWGLGCRWVLYVTLSDVPSCRMPPKICDLEPTLANNAITILSLPDRLTPRATACRGWESRA